MNQTEKNRFDREVEAAAQGNPKIDKDLIREWQKIDRMLKRFPPPPPVRAKPPRLQPIPLRMFNRF